MKSSDFKISKILYEDEKILLCDLIHDLEYYKIFPDGGIRYDVYFRESVEGNSYLTLFLKNNFYVVHADTERLENIGKVVIDFFKDVAEEKKDISVLLLGMGNGNLHRRLNKIKPDVNITTYEYNKALKPICNIVFPPQTRFEFVNVRDYKTVSALDSQKYDIIIDEISYDLPSNIYYYVNHLRNNGTLFFLNDWTRFNTPYNYSSLSKNDSKLIINNISNVDPAVIDIYYKEIKTFIIGIS